MLPEAARGLESLDVDLARETYLETLSAAMFAGLLASPGAGAREVSRAAISAPRPRRSPRTPKVIAGQSTSIVWCWLQGA